MATRKPDLKQIAKDLELLERNDVGNICFGDGIYANSIIKKHNMSISAMHELLREVPKSRLRKSSDIKTKVVLSEHMATQLKQNRVHHEHLLNVGLMTSILFCESILKKPHTIIENQQIEIDRLRNLLIKKGIRP